MKVAAVMKVTTAMMKVKAAMKVTAETSDANNPSCKVECSLIIEQCNY